jgi:hypothetical protein
MLETIVNYKYYRIIPKGWREYVRSESKDDWHTCKKKRKSWTGKQLKAPHLFKRKTGFVEYPLIGVPPAARGGLSECYLEIFDTETKSSVIFIGRVKCSNDDIFCYETGRDLSNQAAWNEYNKWIKTCPESLS